MTKQSWTSHIHFILAISGAAIGLGTVWAAPFTIGSHGGGICLFLYIILTMLIGLPILHLEILMGYQTQTNIIDGINQLSITANASRHWRMIGYLSAGLLFFILSFYVVAGGQVIEQILTNFFKIIKFNPGINQLNLSYISSLIFSGLTFWVSKTPLKRGIERCVKVLMPALFMSLLFILFGLKDLDGFDTAFNYLFEINFNDLNMFSFSAAMGLSFFTLATGAGCMMNYGAYLNNRKSLLFINAISSMMVIIGVCLSGLIVFTISFNQNLAPESGPSLIFITIPIALKQFFPYELWANIIFFLLLLSAAITSSISLLEPLMRITDEKLKISKEKSGVFALTVLLFTSAIYIYSNENWLEKISTVIMEYLLPASALGYVLFARKIKLLSCLPEKNRIIQKLLSFAINYLCPLALIFLLGGHL